jgi:hypothetical protein
MPSNPVKFPEKPAKEKNSHGVGVTVFSAVILAVIIVTFIGAPVVSKVAEQGAIVFGSYDGVPIQYQQGNDFAKSVERLKNYFEAQFQGANIELQRQLVWRQAFEQTALQVALKREAEKAGMVVTDAQIDKNLVNNPDYQKDGKFSEEVYRNTPAADRFRTRQTTRSQLLIQYYVMDRTQGTLLSDATKTFIAAMAYPQRKFSFVTFTDADFPKNLVSDYAEKNKNLFRTVDVSKITVNSESDAQKVREEAVKGDKTFADLAKTYSKDPQAETGGALGVKRYFDLKADIGKAADLDKLFSLTVGAISPVIAGDKVWTIYKINAAAADADLNSSDTQAVVRAYIVKNERGLLEDNLEAQAKAFGTDAKTNFAAAAKKIGKTAQTSDWVALNFGNHDLFPGLASAKDPVFRGLAANEDFFKQAFRLEAGQVSGPILASPSVLVVHVDAIKTAPEKGDTPVLPTSVESAVSQERSQDLEKVILDSPKLEDHFMAEFQRRVQVQ